MAIVTAEYEAVYKVLQKYGESVIKEMMTRLRGLGKVASGKLINSLKYDIQDVMGELELLFEYEDYGDYVDLGVNGNQRNTNSKSPFKYKDKKPPISKLQQWCKLKGIPEGKAWRIQDNIWRYGIAPTFWYTIPTTRRVKQLEKDLESAVAKAVEDDINDILIGGA